MYRIKSQDYTVFVGDVLEPAAQLVETHYKRRPKIILVDENTTENCLPMLQNISTFQSADVVQIHSGEEHKTIETTTNIWKYLSEKKYPRTALFINLGGGVIGDLGGFAASTYKRGIDFINFPTTLLAQVDASIGGKLGVDFEGLKNQVGLFKTPKAVFVHTPFIQTLNQRQLLSGFAEIIKHALIASRSYFDEIQELNFNDYNKINKVISQSVEIKNQIVLSDFLEKNIRKSLNFGHTIGHAIESEFLSSSSPILHGEAVAAGLICESYLSYIKGYLIMEEVMEITNYINSIYSKIEIDSDKFYRLLEWIQNDKKNTESGFNFTLLQNIGKAEINQNCSSDEIIKSLEFYSNS